MATAKYAALETVRLAVNEYRLANKNLDAKRRLLAEICKEAYSAGANDREMSEVALSEGYPISRARIQQFRNGK